MSNTSSNTGRLESLDEPGRYTVFVSQGGPEKQIVMRHSLNAAGFISFLRNRFHVDKSGFLNPYFYDEASPLLKVEQFCHLIFDFFKTEKAVADVSTEINWEYGLVFGGTISSGQKYYVHVSNYGVMWVVGECGGEKNNPVFVEFISVANRTTAYKPGGVRTMEAGTFELLESLLSTGNVELVDKYITSKVLIVEYQGHKVFLGVLLSSVDGMNTFRRNSFALPQAIELCRHWDSFRFNLWTEYMLEGGMSKNNLEQKTLLFTKLIQLQQKQIFTHYHLRKDEKEKMEKFKKELHTSSVRFMGKKK